MLQIPNIIDILAWQLLVIAHLILVFNRFVIVFKAIYWPGSSQIQARWEKCAFNVFYLPI